MRGLPDAPGRGGAGAGDAPGVYIIYIYVCVYTCMYICMYVLHVMVYTWGVGACLSV